MARSHPLKCGVCQQDGCHFLMEARPCLFLCRNDTVGEVFMDERFPGGALFVASIQPEIDGKAYRTTEVMAGHRIVGQPDRCRRRGCNGGPRSQRDCPHARTRCHRV